MQCCVHAHAPCDLPAVKVHSRAAWSFPPKWNGPYINGGQSDMDKAQRIMQRRRLAWRCEPIAAPLADTGPSAAASEGPTQSEIISEKSHSESLNTCKQLTGSDVCPSCLHPMLESKHSPHLLVPCGHSVCLECVSVVIGGGVRSECPCCSVHVASTAPNVALHQLLLMSASTTALESAYGGHFAEAPPKSCTNEPARC